MRAIITGPGGETFNPSHLEGLQVQGQLGVQKENLSPNEKQKEGWREGPGSKMIATQA